MKEIFKLATGRFPDCFDFFVLVHVRAKFDYYLNAKFMFFSFGWESSWKKSVVTENSYFIFERFNLMYEAKKTINIT